MPKFKLANTISIDRYMNDRFSSLRGNVLGSNTYYQCPIHNGKDYSFVVNTDRNLATCFSHSCIRYGDVVKLHSIIRGISQINACDELIKMYGLTLDPCMSNNRTRNTKRAKLLNDIRKQKMQLHEELKYFEHIAFLNEDEFERASAWDEVFRIRESISLLDRVGGINA